MLRYFADRLPSPFIALSTYPSDYHTFMNLFFRTISTNLGGYCSPHKNAEREIHVKCLRSLTIAYHSMYTAIAGTAAALAIILIKSERATVP